MVQKGGTRLTGLSIFGIKRVPADQSGTRGLLGSGEESSSEMGEWLSTNHVVSRGRLIWDSIRKKKEWGRTGQKFVSPHWQIEMGKPEVKEWVGVQGRLERGIDGGSGVARCRVWQFIERGQGVGSELRDNRTIVNQSKVWLRVPCGAAGMN